MDNPSFSINRAAMLLERDRGTVTRALRDVPPDTRGGGKPRWRMRTIVDALAARERSTGRECGVVAPNKMSLPNDIASAWADHDRVLARLRAEPNLERRRLLAAEAGPLVERVDALMKTANRANAMLQAVSDRLVGDAMSKIIGLCEYWPEVEAEQAALRADGGRK